MSEFQDHFSTAAPDYAAHRPTYPPELIDFLAANALGHDLAWDCGCGSGQLSVPLASRFTRVVATDASAAQLAAATPHAHVEYRCSLAHQSDLAPASVDLAVAAQAAHWFDVPAYQAEIRRVARPGALTVLVAYGHATAADAAIDACLSQFHSRTLADYWPPDRQHVDDGYRDLPFPFAAIPSPALWIEHEWTCSDFLGYVATWSAVAALRRAGGTAAVDAFAAELERRWGEPRTRRRIRWPLVVRAGRV